MPFSYKNTNLPISINTGFVLSGATNLKIKIKKPDFSVVEITAGLTIGADGKTVNWQPAITDFDQAGNYKFQVSFTKLGIDYESDITHEQFFEPLISV